MTTVKKAAPKTPAIKPGEECRGRHSTCGGTERAVSASWHLGPACTKAYRAMKKAEPKAAKKDATPKSAGSSPKTTKATKTTAKNSGGTPRVVKPPVPEMHSGVPVARVNAAEQAPHLVQLVG